MLNHPNMHYIVQLCIDLFLLFTLLTVVETGQVCLTGEKHQFQCNSSI